MNRRLLGLLIWGGLFAASGATCPKRGDSGGVLPPEAFAAPPTLEQVVQAVNANSAPVRQLQAEGATLSVQGLPSLRANLVMERPRRFRLVGSLLGVTGPEIDLGSNDELLWMWVKRALFVIAVALLVQHARSLGV